MTERELFFAALDQDDAATRAAYLDRMCGCDTALRQRVEGLLRFHAGADGFLDTPAVEQMAGTNTLDFLAPPQKPDSLGRLGHYEVLGVVNRGATGVVVRAFDDQLQRVVAIKVLAPQLATSAVARQRFAREARATAAVIHDNVIDIHAVHDAGPLPFLVMQYIDGPTLQQKLDRTGPLPLQEILRIGIQTAEGLAAAHRQGLVHRDVKPSNILLENGVERVKITDFGLARAGDDASLTHSGMVAGTPMYMSPEQAEGRVVDARSDLFSLGSVLYAMCTGRPPFRAPSVVAVLKRVCEEVPRPIREINPELPPWLGELVARLHAKDPAGRPASAREVAELMVRHLAERPHNETLASPAPLMEKVAPARRRRGVMASTAALLAVVALAVTEVSGVTHLLRGSERGLDRDVPLRELASTPTGPVALPQTFTNGIGMEFVIVPKGKTWLGGAANEGPGDKEVVIPADYYLGKSEVTQEEWTRVMGHNPSYFSRMGEWKDRVTDIPDADLKRFPVEGVSWEDCQRFLEKLNQLEKQTGWVYRLPTEVEWEYACRGGPMSDRAESAFDYYFAQPTNTLLKEQANFDGTEGSPNRNQVCKRVGTFEANRLGLFDMHGNVWEWCHETETAPDGTTRGVFRGGSWQNQPGYYRAKCRMTNQQPTNRFGALGLRVARVPIESGPTPLK